MTHLTECLPEGGAVTHLGRWVLRVCVRCGRWYEYLSPKPASPTEALDARHELLQRIWDAAIEDTPSWQAALAEAQAQLTAEPSRGEA